MTPHLARLLIAPLSVMLPIVPIGGCCPVRVAREIVSLESREKVIAPGDSVLIECAPVGDEGEELVYEWDADSGTLNGHAGMYAWTAREQERGARITVTVSNTAGDAVSKSIAVVVSKNIPSVITGLSSATNGSTQVRQRLLLVRRRIPMAMSSPAFGRPTAERQVRRAPQSSGRHPTTRVSAPSRSWSTTGTKDGRAHPSPW